PPPARAQLCRYAACSDSALFGARLQATEGEPFAAPHVRRLLKKRSSVVSEAPRPMTTASIRKPSIARKPVKRELVTSFQSVVNGISATNRGANNLTRRLGSFTQRRNGAVRDRREATGQHGQRGSQ